MSAKWIFRGLTFDLEFQLIILLKRRQTPQSNSKGAKVFKNGINF